MFRIPLAGRSTMLTALLVLSGCATLPPAPLVPLGRGDVAVGLSLGADLETRLPELNLWVGAGLGSGVDAAVGLLAPLEFVARVGERSRGGRRPLVPPVMLRRTFANGVGIGVGGASVSGGVEVERDYASMAAVFVTAGPQPGATGPVGRATLHVGVGVVHPSGVGRDEDVRGSEYRGLAVWGTGEAGVGTNAVRPSVRAGSGVWLGGPFRVMQPRVALALESGNP